MSICKRLFEKPAVNNIINGTELARLFFRRTLHATRAAFHPIFRITSINAGRKLPRLIDLKSNNAITGFRLDDKRFRIPSEFFF